MDARNNSIYGGQVYYDPSLSQYYTAPAPVPYNSAFYGLLSQRNQNNRTYLNQSPFSNTNQSQVGSMIANRQPYQYNAPSANQLFPNMTMPTQSQGMPQGLPFQGGAFPGQGNPMMGGNFGAGRFLGQGYANQSGLLGSPSTSMLGT
jgi:hypothetical protein